MDAIKPARNYAKLDADDATREKAAIDLVEDLHQEAEDYRNGGSSPNNSSAGLSLVNEWERNGHRMLGNHWMMPQTSTSLSEGYRVYHFANDSTGSPTHMRRSTLNRTGTSIISNVAGETQEPFSIRFEPVETQDEGTFYLDKRARRWVRSNVVPLLEELAAAEVEEEVLNPDGVEPPNEMDVEAATLAAQYGLSLEEATLLASEKPVPIPVELADKVRAIVALQVQGGLDDESLIEVNDDLRAKTAQTIWDNLWRLANGEQESTINEFFCNIFGNQPLRVQWDHKRQQFWLFNDHILNVWIDHSHRTIDQAEYFIIDFMCSADRAKELYPDATDDIDRAAKEGTLDDDKVRRGGLWQNHNFKRKMVTVRTAWVRYQDVPMSVEEAIEEGKVVEAGPEMVDDIEVAQAGYQLVTGRDEITDEPILGEYVKPQTEVDHGTAWPNTRGLRQIVILPQIRRRVQDIRCPYCDIPVGWNTNIPRPDYSPFGQGEPVRLEDVQQQINRLLSILDNHARFYQFPSRYWPEQVLERLTAANAQLNTRPGANIPIPENDWRMMIQAGGFDRMTQNIPTVPEGYVKLLEMLLNEHDRLSGNVSVRQGVAPAGVKSGVAIDSLRQEASGPLAFKAKFTEWMLERVARIGMDAIIQFMDQEVARKIVSRFEPEVFAEIWSGMSPKSFNIRAVVTAGRGVNERIDATKADALWADGGAARRVDRLTAMEMGRVPNPQKVLKRIEEEDRKAAQAATPQPMDVGASFSGGMKAQGNQRKMMDAGIK